MSRRPGSCAGPRPVRSPRSGTTRRTVASSCPARSGCRSARSPSFSTTTSPSRSSRVIGCCSTPPDRPAATRPATIGGRVARPLPEPLDEWYRLTERWSLPISRDHVFRPAEDLDLTADLVDFWHADDGSERYAFDADEFVFEQGIP